MASDAPRFPSVIPRGAGGVGDPDPRKGPGCGGNK